MRGRNRPWPPDHRGRTQASAAKVNEYDLTPTKGIAALQRSQSDQAVTGRTTSRQPHKRQQASHRSAVAAARGEFCSSLVRSARQWFLLEEANGLSRRRLARTLRFSSGQAEQLVSMSVGQDVPRSAQEALRTTRRVCSNTDSTTQPRRHRLPSVHPRLRGNLQLLSDQLERSGLKNVPIGHEHDLARHGLSDQASTARIAWKQIDSMSTTQLPERLVALKPLWADNTCVYRLKVDPTLD